MDAQERRQAIARRLEGASGPVSAAVLAREHSVSRQIIVGDIALLRAGGMDIAATPRGYVLPAPAAELQDIDTRSDLEALQGDKG